MTAIGTVLKAAESAGDCANCPVWELTLYGVPDGQKSMLQQLRKECRMVRAGRTIYGAGSPTDEIFTLFAGWAFRYKLTAKGERQILSFLLPGNPIGLPLLRFDRLPCSIQALTDVSLCVFPRTALAEYLASEPELLAQRDGTIFREVFVLDEFLVNLGRRTGYERMARFILEIYWRLRHRNATRDASFEFPLKQQHLADALGLSAVHVGRIFAELQGEQLVTLDRGRLSILDLQLLQRAAAIDEREPQGGSILASGRQTRY